MLSTATETKTEMASVQSSREAAEVDAPAPRAAFTSGGAIPPPELGTSRSAAGPSASDLAFGTHAASQGPAADKNLTPDQRSYYDAIRETDPTRTAKDAAKVAGESRPLTAGDRAAAHAVEQQIATLKPRRIDDPKNPNLVQIEVAFDGSGDDRDAMTYKTNPAMPEQQFDGPKHYERGVALDKGIEGTIEMATGAGMQNRIDGAYDNLIGQINAAKQTNPNAQVVLVIVGFSRGAAAARAFVNQLNQRGVPVLSSQQPDGSFAQHYDAPRIGVMVLFDTVEMTPNRHDLSIPANAENVLHITARDEHRTTYPLTRATDPKRPDDQRITEVAMPGSHSDIGGGYPNAYSHVSEQIAEQYMVNAGVHMTPHDPSTTVNVDDPSLRLHDSGNAWFGLPRPTFDSHNPR